MRVAQSFYVQFAVALDNTRSWTILKRWNGAGMEVDFVAGKSARENSFEEEVAATQLHKGTRRDCDMQQAT